MTVSKEERKRAARTGARLLLLAVLVGLVTGVATWAFLTAEHAVINVLWHERPPTLASLPTSAVSVAIVFVMTALAALVVTISRGRPFDLGAAEAEFDEAGRMEYRHLLAGTLFSLFSLFSGAAVGPEAPLTDINGGIGTFIAERLGVGRDHVRMMAYAGVAGAFSAFFGAAPVGALLAAQLINPKAASMERTTLAAGLASGATAWIAYTVLGGGAMSKILDFPAYGPPRVTDVLLAIPIGLVGGLIGLVFGAGLQKTRLATVGLRKRYWLAAAAGGTATAVTAALFPVLLLSGQTQLPQLLTDAATLGVVVLLALGVGKLALTVFSISTAYFGGPIFPLIFAGTCFGLALNVLIPSVPQGVAVMAVIAGMAVAATAAPLSVTVFLAVIVEPNLTSVIAIAAVTAFILRQVVAPTIPGIYRATHAEELRAQAEAEAARAT